MNEVAMRFASIIRQFDEKLTFIPNRQQVLQTTIQFVDDSRLIAFYYVYFDTGRTKYSYQWMTSANQLIRRWDNAHEYPGLSTSPYHQHVGSEENIQLSEPMTLEAVLAFIATQLISG